MKGEAADRHVLARMITEIEMSGDWFWMRPCHFFQRLVGARGNGRLEMQTKCSLEIP